MRLAQQIVRGLQKIATRLKRLATKGLVPSASAQTRYNISFVESFTRLQQCETELRHIVEESRRYYCHLNQDLRTLENALEITEPSFKYLIEKQIVWCRRELDTLSESTLMEELGENEEGSQCSSVYISSCDASSID